MILRTECTSLCSTCFCEQVLLSLIPCPFALRQGKAKVTTGGQKSLGPWEPAEPRVWEVRQGYWKR